MHRPLVFTVLTALPLLIACEAEEPAEEAAVPEAPPAAEQTAMSAEYPDTTAEAVWAYLQEQNYDENWEMWPDKEPFYEGVEPHGALLNTYISSEARQGLEGNDSTLPDHAIIVKENYMPDSTLAATTVMYKVPGYDAENNDWWWLKRNADGNVEASGQAQGCISCHGAAEDNDYVLTGTLESGGTEITAAAESQTDGQ